MGEGKEKKWDEDGEKIKRGEIGRVKARKREREREETGLKDDRQKGRRKGGVKMEKKEDK